MKRGARLGAMCPVCRTAQDWTGDGIFRAHIVCRGDRFVDAHDVAVVVPIGPWRRAWIGSGE